MSGAGRMIGRPALFEAGSWLGTGRIWRGKIMMG
jgi:hypothetical protein